MPKSILHNVESLWGVLIVNEPPSVVPLANHLAVVSGADVLVEHGEGALFGRMLTTPLYII